MRFIPTRIHGIMDYTVSTILSSTPFFLGKKYKTARILFFSAGLGATVYSLLTDYELGVVKKLPMSTHLTLDIMSGFLLAAAPFLLKVNNEEKAPLLAAGMVEIGAGLLTKKA